MRQKKYVVTGGYVTSRSDGQSHYIGPMRVIQLYEVRLDECEIYEPAPWWPRSYYEMAEQRHKDLITLYPRSDGKYTLPSN